MITNNEDRCHLYINTQPLCGGWVLSSEPAQLLCGGVVVQ